MTAPSRSQPTTGHTPTPWFVSGARFRMNGGEWHSINRYDETKKQDENIACVGYDPRTSLGLADAHFIVEAVNNHAALKARIAELEARVAILDFCSSRVDCLVRGEAMKQKDGS